MLALATVQGLATILNVLVHGWGVLPLMLVLYTIVMLIGYSVYSWWYSK